MKNANKKNMNNMYKFLGLRASGFVACTCAVALSFASASFLHANDKANDKVNDKANDKSASTARVLDAAKMDPAKEINLASVDLSNIGINNFSDFYSNTAKESISKETKSEFVAKNKAESSADFGAGAIFDSGAESALDSSSDSSLESRDSSLDSGAGANFGVAPSAMPTSISLKASLASVNPANISAIGSDLAQDSISLRDSRDSSADFANLDSAPESTSQANITQSAQDSITTKPLDSALSSSTLDSSAAPAQNTAFAAQILATKATAAESTEILADADSDISSIFQASYAPSIDASVESAIDVARLNSMGVSVEFYPNLKNSTILYSERSDKRFERFVKQFDSSYEFIPIIRSMIVQAGIPQEFLFLAMAESGFSSRAYSKKKAVGIWQFMPYTAKDLGLRIDDYVDERRDPIKSTQAAIKYLQYLHSATGEWYLAAMAYNCGLGRLQKAIARAGSSELEVLLDEEEKYLPAETRQYIKTILSMSLAFNNAQKMRDYEYLLNRGAMDTLAEVQVSGGTMLASIAVGAGMSLEEIKKYNHHLTYNFLPTNAKSYSIYIPYDRLAHFKQHFDPDKAPKSRFILHRVKKGESLASIAKRYNISVTEIKLTNNLAKPAIHANQKLIIPLIATQKIAQK